MPSTSVSTPAVTKAVSGAREFGHARSGVQRDAQPDLVGVGLVDVVLQQEVTRRVGAVDLEAQRSTRGSAR